MKKIAFVILKVLISNLLLFSQTLDSNLVIKILEKVSPPQRFLEYKPNFSMIENDENIVSDSDVKKIKIYHFLTNGKHFGDFYSPSAILDLKLHPQEASKKIYVPVRYNWGNWFGTRFPAGIWIDGQGVSGDTSFVKIEVSSDSIQLVRTEKWFKTGKYKREATCIHNSVIKIHPIFGIIVNVDIRFTTDTISKQKNTIEFLNFLGANTSSPWIYNKQYEKTIYSTKNNEIEGWYNNVYASDLTNYGKGFSSKQNGFVSFVSDKNKWSSTLLYIKGDIAPNKTCNVWLDQHNNIFVPQKSADGNYHFDVKYMIVNLPPEITEYLNNNMIIKKFKEDSAILIPLGTLENFENQPYSLQSDVKGVVPKYSYVKDSRYFIDHTFGYKSKKSMKVKGITTTDSLQKYDFFMWGPEIKLEAYTKYLIEVMVKVETPDTHAYMVADWYSNDHHNMEQSLIQKNRSSLVKYSKIKASENHKSDWEKISLEFATGAFDPFCDLRFVVLGTGSAWFDDFKFVKIK